MGRVMRFIICVVLNFFFVAVFALYVPLRRFPISNYNQSVDYWISPQSHSFDTPLVSASYQQKRLSDFLVHWFNPWNETYVTKELEQQNPSLIAVEQYFLDKFNNTSQEYDKLNYFENHHLTPPSWTQSIAANIDLASFQTIRFDDAHDAIVTRNTLARLLPSNDPTFYNMSLVGQGYPFDNLSASSIWQGTPAYVITTTQDKRWDLIVTPAVIDWVPANDVAFVSVAQRQQLVTLANQRLGAIIKTQVPVMNATGRFDFEAYVGSIYPIRSQGDEVSIFVASRDTQGNAVFHDDRVARGSIVVMPYSATPHHFSNLYKALIGRPYGWGGMYFYNDCSQELKNVYAPFGIWLSRNSAAQEQAGVVDDQTSLTESQRLEYLVKHGRPFMTEIYVGGHIMQFIGNYANTSQPLGIMPMTYQNVWGLNPPNTLPQFMQRRDVIGGAVLFPLLMRYIEAPDDVSFADLRYFKLIYLDQMPTKDAFSPMPLMRLMAPDVELEYF